MVTKEQILNGIIVYIDKEVIPHLSTAGKWYVGTMVTLLSSRYNHFYEEMVDNSFIKSLGIVDDRGMVDLDLLVVSLMENAEKYGKLQINVPVIGTMTFSSDDVSLLEKYILGGV